jgi:hypothetical protein
MIFGLAVATVWLTLAFSRAAWYFKFRALRDLQLPHPESLTSGEKRRLKHYFYGVTYLSAVFCLLRGRSRTNREKYLFTNLAALAYFFDDLVDESQPGNDGAVWQDNPEAFGASTDARGLALHFLRNVYQTLPPSDVPEFKSYMHRVFNIETAGRQAGAGKVNLPELEAITAEKGGYSVLLFRRVLANPLSETEQEALYQMGYLVQLCDDVFDIWFDLQSGIRTIPGELAHQGKTKALTDFFEKQVSHTYAAFIRYSGFKSAAARGALHFLVTVTRVCLQHYAELQKKHGTLPLDDRSAMVVDMERWQNRIRAARWLVFKL